MADRFGRNFLLLQGPHGPFFSQLGTLVEQTGATAWQVGFNGGDAFFWRNKARFIAHAEGLGASPAVLSTIIAESLSPISYYMATHAPYTQML